MVGSVRESGLTAERLTFLYWGMTAGTLRPGGAIPSVPPAVPSVIPYPIRSSRCPLSVIPDVFNRESRIFPRPGHTNAGSKEKDTGFPLTPCGNDRGGAGAPFRLLCPPFRLLCPPFRPVMPTVPSVMPDASFLSFPTFVIGNPEFFPGRGTRMEGQKRRTLDSR